MPDISSTEMNEQMLVDSIISTNWLHSAGHTLASAGSRTT